MVDTAVMAVTVGLAGPEAALEAPAVLEDRVVLAGPAADKADRCLPNDSSKMRCRSTKMATAS